jgi:hypothetical protein
MAPMSVVSHPYRKKRDKGGARNLWGNVRPKVHPRRNSTRQVGLLLMNGNRLRVWFPGLKNETWGTHEHTTSEAKH